MTPSVVTVEQADRILDRLEELCKSELDNLSFLTQGCLSIQSLTSAAQVVLVTRWEQTWVEVVNTDSQAFETADWLDHGYEVGFSGQELMIKGRTFYAYPLAMGEANEHRGSLWGLCIGFAQRISTAQRQGIELLVDSLQEMLQGRLQTNATGRRELGWQDLSRFASNIGKIEDSQSLGRYLVDHLPVLVQATRASLFSVLPTGMESRLLATTLVTKIDSMSERVQGLERLVQESLSGDDSRPRMAKVVYQDSIPAKQGESSPGSIVTGNYVLLPWSGDSGSTTESSFWLLIEWADRKTMASVLPTLSGCFGALHAIWDSQSRWVSLPRWAKRFSLYRGKPRGNSQRVWSRVFWLCTLGCLGFAIFMPTRLVIDCPGVLEPVHRKTIHATEDGTLVELLVSDGEKVIQDQKLAQLRSPRLEMLIEGVLGEIRSLSEKRNGIRVAMNQIVSGTQDARAIQTRLSSEGLVLDTQEKQAREKLAFLKSEQETLTLKAPISGVVAGSQLKQHLVNKPVKRGESLLQILQLNGPWQLSLNVLDRDSGYVRAHYPGKHDSIEFYFESDAKHRFEGKVSRVTPQIDRDLNQTNYQRVYADIDRSQFDGFPTGASVRAEFNCGKQPMWFVWSRPMIEYIQRRFSYFSSYWGAD